MLISTLLARTSGLLTAAGKSARAQIANHGALLFLAAFCLGGIGTYTINVLDFVYRHSEFREEDFDAMWLAHTLPLSEYLASSIDEHFVPLHRLVAYLTDAAAPMNFAFALLVLCGFHLIGAAYMYRILKLCETGATSGADAQPEISAGAGQGLGGLLLKTPMSWLLFGSYCTYVYLGPVFIWWTAGLHRLPLLAFGLMAIYYYLQYRHSRSVRTAAACILSTLLAFGFFTKCVLIPVYLAAIEVCLWSQTTAAARRINVRVLGPLLAASLAYVLLWRILEPPYRTAIELNPNYHLQFIGLSWSMLRDSLIGSVWQEVPTSPASRIATFCWVIIVVYTVARARSNIVIWAVLSTLLVLNVLLTSVSKLRADLFGLILPVFLHRYYFELFAIVVIFMAMALQRARSAPEPQRWHKLASIVRKLRGANWAASIAVVGILAAIMLNSYSDSTHLMKDFYLRHALTRIFIGRVKSDSARILRANAPPLQVVDDALPEIAGMKGRRSALYLLEAMGIPASPAPPGPGVYRISESGHVVASTLGP